MVMLTLLARPDIDVELKYVLGGDPFDRGETPFTLACLRSYPSSPAVVKLLLSDSRVDVNVTLNGGYTIFHLLCMTRWCSHLDGTPCHLESKGYRTCTESENKWSILNMLLNNPRVDINKEADDGYFPLLSAKKKGCPSQHRNSVELLLSDPRIDANRVMKPEQARLAAAKEEEEQQTSDRASAVIHRMLATHY